MTAIRIIYSRPDGVSVVIPAPGANEQQALNAVPAGAAYEIVSAAEIPSDRTFRNAWEMSGKAVAVNMTKAKGIAHDKRRASRAAEFAPLDIEAIIPGKAQQAEAARQAVRDKYAAMQSEIDACATPESLKSVLLKYEVQ